MIKKWIINAEVNMCAEHEIKQLIKANTERKAKILAENNLYKEGYFYVRILSCNELKKKPIQDYKGDNML